MRAIVMRAVTTGCVSAALLASGATAASAGTVKVAYEKSGHSEQVWVVNADGSHGTRLGAGEQPLISPDGTMVAASEFGPHGHALVIYSTSGKPKQGYLNLATTSASALAWSPDSRYLAVELIDQTASGTATKAGDGGVGVVDTTAHTIKRIAAGFPNGASFDPARAAGDRLAYGLAHAHNLNPPSNIATANPDGSDVTQITHDGRSLYPVWGAGGIAFDRERFRGDNAPAFNIWSMQGDGSHATQVTHLQPGPLRDGLIPLALSASGNRMIAQYVGEDTNEAYTVSVTGHRARRITVPHHSSVQAGGISSNGRTLLVTLDAFENPTAAGKVALLPFSGGQPKVLANHAGFGSWNG
jgi:hypothetical protein